jgi:hypothetical protein
MILRNKAECTKQQTTNKIMIVEYTAEISDKRSTLIVITLILVTTLINFNSSEPTMTVLIWMRPKIVDVFDLFQLLKRQ